MINTLFDKSINHSAIETKRQTGKQKAPNLWVTFLLTFLLFCFVTAVIRVCVCVYNTYTI